MLSLNSDAKFIVDECREWLYWFALLGIQPGKWTISEEFVCILIRENKILIDELGIVEPLSSSITTLYGIPVEICQSPLTIKLT
jgi:hypothetical protein